MAGLSVCPLFTGADERKWDFEQCSSLARAHPTEGVSPDSVPPQNCSRNLLELAEATSLLSVLHIKNVLRLVKAVVIWLFMSTCLLVTIMHYSVISITTLIGKR